MKHCQSNNAFRKAKAAVVIISVIACWSPKASAEGVFQSLYEFPSSGTEPRHPATRLLESDDGYFYGTTGWGGTSDYGTVFKFRPDTGLIAIASFEGTNGSHPFGGLVKADDGNFYGVTSAGGVDSPLLSVLRNGFQDDTRGRTCVVVFLWRNEWQQSHGRAGVG